MRFFIQNGGTSQNEEIKCSALVPIIIAIFNTMYVIILTNTIKHGLSEPECYGDLVYKFKKIRGMTDFSDQFRKIIIRYKPIGYNLNVM